LETDSGGAVLTRQLGLAEREALPLSAATANASVRIRGSGFDTQASSFGAVSVLGSLAIQNLSHATLSWDAQSAVAAVSINSLRGDLVTCDPSTARHELFVEQAGLRAGCGSRRFLAGDTDNAKDG
jgi:hypothetical protein